jgi:hypothetical protein
MATTSISYIQGSHCPMKKFNIYTTEYETTTLLRNIGHRHRLTLRHITEERAVIEFHSVFQEVRQGCFRDNVCPSKMMFRRQVGNFKCDLRIMI